MMAENIYSHVERITELETSVARLKKQMEGVLTALDPSNGPSFKENSSTGDLYSDQLPDNSIIPRGQYKGKTHKEVIALDPWHILWLDEKCFASGLNYTFADIEEAREQVRIRGPNPRQSKTQNAAKASGYR